MEPHDQKVDSGTPVVPDKPVATPTKDANPVTNSVLVESLQQQHSEGIQPHHFMDLFRPTVVAASSSSSGHKDGASSGQQTTKQQSTFQCGRGPVKIIQQRATLEDGAEAEKNSWPFLVSLVL